MALLFADECFDLDVVVELRRLGHDIVTVKDVGLNDQKMGDAVILAYAHSVGRAVLTFNRKDFRRLHPRSQPHSGIINCTNDDDKLALAARIHHAISNLSSLDNQLIRVNRPHTA
jgi:predicted nuclease of predicted toxin-antitoxin system